MLNTVLELLCTIALTVAIVGAQKYLSTRQAWQLGAVVPLLSLAVLVGATVIWSLPLSAKLVVPGLLILGLELLLWVDGRAQRRRRELDKGDALAVVLCGTLRSACVFWRAWAFLGSGAFRRHGKGRFVYFLDTRAVIISKNRRHILAVFVELGYTITT